MQVQFRPPEEITDERLVEIALGRARALPRAQALNLLRERRQQPDLFATVLEDPELDARSQHVAIMGIYESDPGAAERFLIPLWEALETPGAIATLVQVLGRVGSAAALETILAIRDEHDGFARRQAGFAAALLSYRHQLDGLELPAPDPDAFLDIDADEHSQGIEIGQFPEDAFDLLTAALAAQPYRVEFDLRSASQIDCAPNRFALVFTEQASGTGSIERVTGRKMFAGVLASHDPEAERYSTRLLMLSTPDVGDESRARIELYRPTGEAVLAGQLSAAAGQVRINLRTLAGRGMPAVNFEASYDGRRLQARRAVSSGIVRDRRVPRLG